MDGKIKVLYVDDEMNNLVSFKASFRKDYDVVTASSPAEALEKLAANSNVHIVISDQRMPVQTGVEFFNIVREKYPMPVRMLCTGFTDVGAVIESINKGKIFRYIQKPWSETDIRFAIDEGYKYYRAKALLAETNAELLKANTELDKFSHSVTHDLRSPILSVLGAIDIAQDADSMEDVREMLGLMKNAMVKLDGFIFNMHDYYTIRHGDVKANNIDFEKLVSDLKAIFELHGKTDNISFYIEQNIQHTFVSDETVINIILNNLLSNAFKYQQKDQAEKYVKLCITVLDGSAVFEVSDNGIGFNDEQSESIFGMFYRISNDEFGTGFGLYNVKDALGKLNGKIEVTSKKNEGSLFRVTLPSLQL